MFWVTILNQYTFFWIVQIAEQIECTNIGGSQYGGIIHTDHIEYIDGQLGFRQ